MNRINTLLLAVLLLSGCGTFYPGEPFGARPRFNAALNGENEVPPTSSPARGTMVADYLPQTKVMHWALTLRGLSGPVTWAFLCGPDGVGNNSAELVPINLELEGGTHPGAVTLTDQQAADLIAGRWYVNIKTEKFPAGEIRGPLMPTTTGFGR
jgi:CHRD domain-containing protein